MSKQEQYKKIYIQESEELLSIMNKGLLDLEQNPMDKSSLNELFRAAHTLKSMSATMEYKSIAIVSHKMEDVLDIIRSGKISISSGVVNVLFSSFDALETMNNQVIKDGEIEFDAQKIIKKLSELSKIDSELKEEKVGEELLLNKFDKKTLARVKKDQYNCFYIKIKLEKGSQLKSVRVFMVIRNLHKIGEVIKSYPDVNSINEESFDQEFGLIFITKEKRDAVINSAFEVLEVEDVKVENVPVEDSWIDDSSTLDEDNQERPDFIKSAGHTQNINSIRVDVKSLDKMMNLVEELSITKLKLFNIGKRQNDSALNAVIDEFSRLTDEFQEEIMQARLVPVGYVFDRYPRLVRDIAKKQGKEIKFEIEGSEVKMDRSVLDEIGEPIVHLLRNAVDHAIEEPSLRVSKGKPKFGKIILKSRRVKDSVVFEVADDGVGMDADAIGKKALKQKLVSKDDLSKMTKSEVLMLSMLPGLSTKKEVSEISGRGVGLDVVKEKAESLGGFVSIKTEINKGSTILMSLPVTASLIKALLVDVENRIYAIPISNISEIISLDKEKIKVINHQESITHREHVLPIVRLSKMFDSIPSDVTQNTSSSIQSENKMCKENLVVIENEQAKFGVIVNRLVAQQDIVIKQLGRKLKGVKGFSGATILGDGKVALVLDMSSII